MSVSTRFSEFLANISQSENQLAEGRARRESAVRCLNQHYYGSDSGTSNSYFIGSWAKFTKIRPPRDVDVFYQLPIAVYNRFSGRYGNIQSQLLQEIRSVLARKFLRTSVKGSGPIVEVGFSSYSVEIAPGFKDYLNREIVCVTKGGGQFQTTDYAAESAAIVASNQSSNGNTRDLVRMMKCWQSHCNVPMRSFWIELLAIQFLQHWPHRGSSKTYYDWMCRDFFEYVIGRSSSNIYAPGTGEAIYLGSAWLSRAETAYRRAVSACENETNYPYTAGGFWRQIFGDYIPLGG